jgi:prepilin-type N-terminal cleavage/methylation domain-containing protein
MIMKTQLYVSDKGFTLLELLMAIGLMSFLGLGVMTVASMSSRTSNSLNISNGATGSYVTTVATLQNASAWNATVAANPSMACLQNHTDCAAAGGTFQVFDEKSNLYYDATVAANGFDQASQRCSTFGKAGDQTCVYRYDIVWKPLCPTSGACIDPLVNIKGTFKMSAAAVSKASVNTQNYSFSAFVGYKQNYFDQACTSLAGTYSAPSKQCNFQTQATHCAPGQVITGIDFQGKPTCAAAVTGRCPPGQAVVGIGSDGAVQCKDRAVASTTTTTFDPGKPNACPQANPPRNAGEVWQVPNGVHRIALPCPGSDPKVQGNLQYQIYDDWLEVTCSASDILPTGRTTSTARANAIEGTCPTGVSATPPPVSGSKGQSGVTCPAGVANGDVFWGTATNYTDVGSCPNDLSQTSTRSYQAQMQYRCNGGITVSTGVIQKTLVSNSPCPGACADDQVTLKDPLTGKVTCQAYGCSQFREITSYPIDIPPRTSDHICYYKKLFSVIPFSPSSDTPNPNMYARNHSGGTPNAAPLTLGFASNQFRLLGQRAVKLSGGISTVAPIVVDNFVVTGRRSYEESQLLNDWDANGTADSTISGYRGNGYIQAYSQDVPLVSFGPAGTATVNALVLKQFQIYRQYTADIHAMDCGGARQLSDVYLIFQ